MAINELNTLLIINNHTAAEWEASTYVLLRGEMGIANDTFKFKIGDGVHTWSQLSNDGLLTKAEVEALIRLSEYQLPAATTSSLGGVKIGTNINISADGTISVSNGSTAAKGVVQLSEATNSTSTSLAATASAVKKAYDLANTAVPKSGATMTGFLILSADPTNALGAATKQYVDTQIVAKLQTSDAMTLKGTLGTGGTITAIPTTNVTQGDTYKIITKGSYAGWDCDAGDMLVAMASGSITATTTNWLLIPSGDEDVTTIKVATSGVNVNGTAKTGNVVFGMAAAKQVDASIASGSTSANLPTSAAVAQFVEGKGYQTTDNKVYNALNKKIKAYITGTTSASSNTGSQVFDSGVYLTENEGELAATTFKGNLVGDVTGNLKGVADKATTADSATKLGATRNFSISGGAVAAKVGFTGQADVNLVVTALNAMQLTLNAGDTLILNGTHAI